jgi:hypothetical protein
VVVSKAGTARIAGRVISAETGAPLRRAYVRLSLSGPPQSPGPQQGFPTVATDAQGRYEFRNLPSGRYSLTAEKTGHVLLSYGQRRPREAGRPLEIKDGQDLGNADFALPRGAVILARVTDDRGEPVEGVSLQAAQYSFVSGERRLMPVSGGLFASATNDKGGGRLHGLMPGDYYVLAGGGPGGPGGFGGIGPADSTRVFGPTYYPGTASEAEAQRVTVAAGQEVQLSFPLTAMRLLRLSVVVRDSEGKPARNPLVSLRFQFVGGSGSRGLFVQPDGTFGLSSILPGEYTIAVNPSATATNATQEFASVPVRLTDRDLTGLVVTTTPGTTLRGRLVFEDGAPPPPAAGATFNQWNVNIRFADSLRNMGRSNTRPDWTFEVTGVSGTGVIQGPSAISGWYLKAVMLDGKDVTDTPVDFERGPEIGGFEVVMTQKRAEMSGDVSDAAGPVSDFVAVVFPQHRQQWTPQSRYIAIGRPDQKGEFQVRGLPAGAYLVSAVEYLEPGEERDPEVLRRLAEGATPVTLADGEARRVSLRLTR